MKNVLATLLCASTPLMALEIQLDFVHDEAADQFFSSNPAARSAVQKAALDIGSMLSNSMTAVTTDIYEGTNGSTTARFDWSWNYVNPVTGGEETIYNPSIAADTVVIYVGTRKLGGSILGQGGVGGAAAQISIASNSPLPSEWIGAVDSAEALSNATMSRGSGPTLGTISGAANFSGSIGRYDLDFGLSVGNLWFDADTDNNGSRDSSATLNNYWHFDAYSEVEAGKMDFYSVALHEILHVMGIGTSQTWQDLAASDQWLGTEASLAAGTSALIDGDGVHALGGLMSTRVSDGVLQEALISPSLTPGVRKELTELDQALLLDLGYEINFQSGAVSDLKIPEPSSLLMLAVGSLVFLGRKKR